MSGNDHTYTVVAIQTWQDRVKLCPLELTKDQAMRWKAHQAEEKGVEFDSSSVTGPLTIWRLKGLGAEIKGEV